MDETRGGTAGSGRQAPGRIAGERKPVTALFVDIVGSTALAETMDPEEWAELVNGAFHVLSGPVARYEGTVAQLQGDAMVAFFGAPVTHEDDPERAVRAALAMVEGIDAYSQEVSALHGVPFQVRVGLNTGPVVVGHVGSDGEGEEMGEVIHRRPFGARLRGIEGLRRQQGLEGSAGSRRVALPEPGEIGHESRHEVE